MDAAGACACGKVRFTATLGEAGFNACHCATCLAQSAGPEIVASVSSVAFDGEPAVWRSSAFAERMFCEGCGATVGYRLQNGSWTGLAAYLFDPPLDLPLVREVFHDVKPGGYDFVGPTEHVSRAALLAQAGAA